MFLRSESVETTSLHLHQPVPPVGPGHPEIVDGSPDDAEGLSLQGELGRVGAQTQLLAHDPPPCWQPERRVPVSYSHSEEHRLLCFERPHDMLDRKCLRNAK